MLLKLVCLALCVVVLCFCEEACRTQLSPCPQAWSGGSNFLWLLFCLFHWFLFLTAENRSVFTLLFLVSVSDSSNVKSWLLIWLLGTKKTPLWLQKKKNKQINLSCKNTESTFSSSIFVFTSTLTFSLTPGRYGPSPQLRGHEEGRDWLRSHSTSGLQDSASNSPFSPGSSLTSPSGTRFNFGQLGTPHAHPRNQLSTCLHISH